MTYSGIATIYTCINRFTIHNFYVALGPAGFWTATISLVAFLCSDLLIIYFFIVCVCIGIVFSFPPTHLPSLPGVVYPWRSACLGRGGGLVKEEGRERGSGRSMVWEGGAPARSASPSTHGPSA